MLAIRLLTVALLSLCLAATTAQAGLQLYKGAWIAESFGNDVVGQASPTESQHWSVFGMPQGVLCNPYAPRCKFTETPVSDDMAATPMFAPLGPDCINLTAFATTVRPAKGGTAAPGVPPLYRNPFFFQLNGNPKVTSCTAYSTTMGGYATMTPLTTDDPLRDVVAKGAPVAGYGYATTTANTAFKIIEAPPWGGAYATPKVGMFRTTTGEFNNIPPYLYSYTYATFRNDQGTFAANGGFFSAAAVTKTVNLPYSPLGTQVASITVKRGPQRFGGVMKLLGKLTTKVCFFYAGGCSLGGANWLYQSIGAAAYKGTGSNNSTMGVVTAGLTVMSTTFYYNTALNSTSTLTITAYRFPWTTGNVTLTATGRGPHKTVEARKGRDNRNSLGVGTMQLVSPILTRWQGSEDFETGGIAILKLNFVPEAENWMMLAAGLSLLGVLFRYRGR
jgi:hypothetical protein